MDNDQVLTFADLKRATGYSRQADVERCLKDQRIRFFWGKDGIWTTLRALHAAHGLDCTEKQSAPEISFDFK